MEDILTVSGLRAYYEIGTQGRGRQVRAVDDISMSVGRNEIYGIAGESSSGKTSFIKVLAAAVRVRPTRAPREARLFRDADGLRIELAIDEEGVSPGQACVIYTDAGPGAQVLGGGTILRRPLALPASPSPAALALS